MTPALLSLQTGFQLANFSFSKGQELNRRRVAHDCVKDQVAAGMEALGATVTMEVTFEYEGRRARFDIVASEGGVPIGVTEIKTNLDFLLNRGDPLVRNQPFVSQGIRNGGAIPVGANAAAAGFLIDKPLGRPMQVHVFDATVPRCK